MISKQINSSILIFDIIDKYAIKSEDFVTRAPKWITSCLDDIGIKSATVTDVYETEFNHSRCLLPPFCEGIDWVYINGVKADYDDSLYVHQSEVELNRAVSFEGGIGLDLDDDLTNLMGSSSPNTVKVLDKDVAVGDNIKLYRLSNGWLHTNISSGTIEIKYRKIPVAMDYNIGLEFPIIPDEYNLKEAIIQFMLKNILMRGYSHPILNLKENNPIVNPGLAYKNFRDQARVINGRPNADSRDNYKRPLVTLFGKRRKLHIDRKPYAPEPSLPDMNKIPYRVAYSLDPITYANPVELVIINDVHVGVQLPVKEGYNYLFLSIPANKKFTVFNQVSLNITDEFEDVGIDEVVGYMINTVYRSKNKFYTGVSYQFLLEIN